MKLQSLAIVALLAASRLSAQATIETLPLNDDDFMAIVPETLRDQVEVADQGVLLRALDKVSGEVVDFELEPGQTKQLGRILVSLEECRYPVLNPSGDAFAFVSVYNSDESQPVFSGWMIASSPALNGLDHPRYDVWPLRCVTETGD